MTPSRYPFVGRQFWNPVGAGMSPREAGVSVGVSQRIGWVWFADAGGVKPTFVDETAPRLRSRLSVEEREEIQDGVARGESIRSMARRLDRAPSTVMREINRNGSYRGPGRYRARYRFGARWRGGWDPTPRYRASQAHARAWRNARRSRPGKLATIRVWATRCRPGWKMNSTAPSRSPDGCGSTSPTTRRCRCLTRPSIWRFTFRAKGIYAANCIAVCAPDGPCVNRIAVLTNVAAGSRTG